MGFLMNKTIISLILLLTSVAPGFAASGGDLLENAPDRYVVVERDTLWTIAARYLKEPWRWPELWKMNQAQIRNPNRIYPGDVLVLDRSQQEAQLRVLATETITVVKLTPQTRVEPLAAKPVPSIAPAVLEPFLVKPLIVGPGELDGAARIIATQESRVALGAGNTAYAKGVTKAQGTSWQIIRRGDPLVDPDTKEILGYTGIYLGEARVLEFGEVSTLEITKSAQEIYAEDRLLPTVSEVPVFAYVPHAPPGPVRARIVSAYNSLYETGPLGVVALSKGSRDGLEVGHVLAIYRNQAATQYGMRTDPLFGRSGPAGSDAPRPYYGVQITPRDAPVFESSRPLRESDLATLPPERYGLVMIFRTFDRASFGVIMNANRQVSLFDIATNP
jgi:hypothetical protein